MQSRYQKVSRLKAFLSKLQFTLHYYFRNYYITYMIDCCVRFIYWRKKSRQIVWIRYKSILQNNLNCGISSRDHSQLQSIWIMSERGSNNTQQHMIWSLRREQKGQKYLKVREATIILITPDHVSLILMFLYELYYNLNLCVRQLSFYNY